MKVRIKSIDISNDIYKGNDVLEIIADDGIILFDISLEGETLKVSSYRSLTIKPVVSNVIKIERV